MTDTSAIETQSVVPGPDLSSRASEQTTRVAFFTDTHRIIADVDTGARRLVELLRDSTRTFVDLKHISLARIADSAQPVASSPRGVLQKSDIQLAAILSEADRPQRRLYGYVAKTTVRVLALLRGCEIVGDLHLPEGTKDGVTGYLNLRDTFIHLGAAQVSFSIGAAGPSLVNTVVVNRASIQFLCLAD